MFDTLFKTRHQTLPLGREFPPKETLGSSLNFPYQLSIFNARNVRIPPHVTGITRFEINVSLFRLDTNCFFGNTWVIPIPHISPAPGSPVIHNKFKEHDPSTTRLSTLDGKQVHVDCRGEVYLNDGTFIG
jgi:hypothetical protein